MKNTITGLIMPKSWYITRIVGRRRMFIITYGILFNALVWYIFSLVSPAVGESFIFNVSIISGVLTAGWIGFVTILGLIVTSPLVSITASVSYRTYKQNIAPLLNDGVTQQRALPSGNNFDIYPDRIVVEQPFGNRSDFENEVRAKHETLPKNSWLFIFEFRRPYTRVADGSESGVFVERSDMAANVDEDHKFESETPQQYYQWVSLAIPSLKAHMEKQRIQKTDKNVVSAIYQRTIVVLMLLFFSGIATAQTNTERVVSFLGAAANEVPDMEEPVLFQFEKKQILRYGDKESKIGEMVAQRVGADNGDYGQLKAVYRSGRVLSATGKQVIPATGTAAKPAPLMQSYTAAHNEALPAQKSFSESLPDSAAVANGVNQIIHEGDSIKAKIWKAIAPAWVLAMWFFDSIFFLLIGSGGVFWYYAKTARQNGNLGYTVLRIQRWASRNVLYVCWVITTVVLVNTFLHLIYMDWPVWSVMVVWAIILGIALWLTNKVTPNGEEVYFKDGFAEHRQLHGGGGKFPQR